MTNIILGTWSWGAGMFGGDSVFGVHTDEQTLKPVFDAAEESGVRTWDTATAYAMGESERILGTFIAGKDRSKFTISTKFTPQLAEMYNNSVETMADASMERMGIDYIDIYWIHNSADVERWTPGLIPLLKSGKVRRVGVSNHDLAQIKRADEILAAAGFRVSAVQNHFSLLYRNSERDGILDYCRQNNIEFWGYMVLEQGALSGKYNAANPLPADSDRGRKYNPILQDLENLTSALTAIGKRHGLTCSQTAVAWALTKGVKPIVGVTKPYHVTEVAQAASVILTSDEVAELDRLADAAGIDARGGWEGRA